MLAEYCYAHAHEILPLVSGRRLLFLGDSDCISLAVMSAAKLTGCSLPKTISVLDFDKRVLDYIQNGAKELGVFNLRTTIYNVLDPIDGSLESHDFIHINPPFGSRNGGKSVATWLYRAADLCGQSCSACVILASNADRTWCQISKRHLLNESSKLGFSLKLSLETQHVYDSPWDLELRSQAFLFSTNNKISSPLIGKKLSEKSASELYGEPVQIPIYVDYVDGNLHQPIFINYG